MKKNLELKINKLFLTYYKSTSTDMGFKKTCLIHKARLKT
jgi:hypothetical protein